MCVGPGFNLSSSFTGANRAEQERRLGAVNTSNTFGGFLGRTAVQTARQRGFGVVSTPSSASDPKAPVSATTSLVGSGISTTGTTKKKKKTLDSGGTLLGGALSGSGEGKSLLGQ